MGAARKPKTAPLSAPAEQIAVTVDLPGGGTATVVQSSFGVELDPIDGRPVFADGMSRRRWLDATAEDRHAQLVAELRADPITDDAGE